MTRRERISRFAPIAAVIAIGLVYATWQLAGGAPQAGDATTYYLAGADHPYLRSTVGADYAYLYSPAFTQILEPLRALPLNVYVAVWTMLLIAALAWTARTLALPLLLFQPVVASIALGNIELLIAAAIIAGFRWPAAWSFVLLSKVSPGIGLVWFLVRREWRSLALAIGTTAAIAAVSFALAPRLWFDWVDVLVRNRDATVTLPVLPGPVWLRAAAGAVLVAWGARSNRRWTVPFGAGIAVPVGWFTFTAIIVVGIAGLIVRTPDFSVRRLVVAIATPLLHGGRGERGIARS